MKNLLPLALVTITTMAVTGCATRKYVRNTVAPVSGKLDQVATKTDQQGQTLDQTRQSLDQTKQTIEKDETQLSATTERAMSADNKAGQAMQRADEAGQKADQANQRADQVGRDLGDLRSTVANLDDYKQVGNATVNFKFNSDKLSSEAKQQLDQMVSNQNQYKRYFIAVEGFTDSVGSDEYNAALSRRRADAVVEYLVASHNIPVYRIHMVGLGKQKPVEEGRTSAARAKNRRVEVALFSADQGAMAMNTSGAPSSGPASQPSRSGNQPQ
jgi:outer membrane protein OmpA-like peptidoglycan-associated protein